MVDVVVIGAGLAGLLVTYRLRAAGVEVALVEARDRTGGRTLSAPTPDGPVDLGASWVWDTDRHVHALLAELDIATFAHHRDGIDVFEDGPALRRGRLPRSAVPERRIVGGPKAICDALTARVGSVSLGATVRAIEATPDGVRVVGTRDTLHARRVVATVPPALLASRVAVEGLDPEQQAIMRHCAVWMADIAKVVAVYDRRFWVEAGLSGRAASTVGPLSETHDLSGPQGRPAALFGFVHRIHAGGDWQARARAQLVRLFGPEAGRPTHWYAMAWWTEPCTAPDGDAGRAPEYLGHPRLREPALEGRLLLASAETAAGSPGHLDGAVERAEAVSLLIQSS